MPLTVGDRLGHYEVSALIGEGGMGEVYQATDTKLKRQVALKILPEAFSADPERLARFQREAEVLASLNHPGIAAIYGLEESDGIRALVLELVEGPTLADRIKQGPIPLDEALPIAKQIAEALEAAHEAGVIHRDLKPANIKVRDDGTVKVLDFGLAKALDPSPTGDPSQSPTLTAAATQMGVIMGTAAYMSPEQARGKPTDRRADIWAFGAVLFEMLTGTRAFEGEDVSVTLADVIRAEPAWEQLPDALSPSLHTYLTRCLQKDPTQRVQAIGDMRLAMEGSFEVSSVGEVLVSQPIARQLMPWAVAAVMGIVAAIALVSPWVSPESRPAGAVTRFEIPMPPTHDLFRGGGAALALTPDGRSVIYICIADEGRALYRRPLNELSAVVIPGTEGAVGHPAISPDGSMLAFLRNGQPTVIEVTGGTPRTVSDARTMMGLVWADDSTLVFPERAPNLHLSRVSATGGEPVTLVSGEGPAGTGYNYPDMLPGGDVLVYTVWGGNVDSAKVAARSLTTGEERVLWEGSSPHLTTTGHLLFARDNDIWAAAFNATTLEAIGEPVRVVEDVQVNGGGLGLFAVSSNGTLGAAPAA